MSTNRSAFPKQRLDSCAQAGLLLACGLEDAQDIEKAKRALLKAAERASKNTYPYYSLAYKRWVETTSSAKRVICRTRQRLVVGLGTDNVLETGIALHHTYGTPIIPGSALKGLAAHHCNSVWGRADVAFALTGSHFRTLFGALDSAGFITFLDAWILPDSLKASSSGLSLDVMTPHHPNYYMGDQPPTDRDDPNPIAFLSVTGAFDIAVQCDDATDPEQANRWSHLALQLVTEALSQSGAGGKTSSGYGRMDVSNR